MVSRSANLAARPLLAFPSEPPPALVVTPKRR